MNAEIPFHERIRSERERRGWSQADLAEKMRCDTRTVGRWERGERAPRHFHRRDLAELFGISVEDLMPDVLAQDQDDEELELQDPAQTAFLRADWGEAPYVTELYGRDEERALLSQWMHDPVCRIGVILGLGGEGKTVLAAVAARAQQHYDLLFWRSLQDALPFEQYVRQCLDFFSPQAYIDLPKGTDEQIALLMKYVQKQPCLLVLDNFETLLQTELSAGHYRAEYAAYGRFLRRFGEKQHKSFLLVTSRERPREIAHLEGKRAPVRVHELPGLACSAGQQMLSEKSLQGTEQDWETLVRHYAGNPLALHLVAEFIQTVFAGEIAQFLGQKIIAFGGIHDLLDQHFQRLSPRELELMCWLALEREPASVSSLQADLASPAQPAALMEALDSLRRRFLIEPRGAGRFALQPVILEYVTGVLIERAQAEFGTDPRGIWSQYALLKAQASEYVRTSQERLLLAPVAQSLLSRLSLDGILRRARELLDGQRQEQFVHAGYLAGNLLNLLNYLHCDLRGFDFSHLVIRQAYLQGMLLPEVNFAHARFIDTLFTGAFGNVLAVACHPQGTSFAVGTSSGEIRVYETATYALCLLCQGHVDGVWSLAFSPDGNLLVSCSDDHTVRLWDSRSGVCLHVLQGHSSRVRALAFHPAGHVLASGSDDTTICLWDVKTGTRQHTLSGHDGRVWSLAFQHQGRLLASGSTDQMVRLWDWATGNCEQILPGHENAIRSVVFHPGDERLASGSDDQTVRLWEVKSGTCLNVLRGHTNRVWSLAYDTRGDVLASASEDQTIRLWQGTTGESQGTLSGHRQGVRSIAFLPEQPVLVSGGDDQTIRVWDITTGNSLMTTQGYAMRVLSLAFNSDGSLLATGSEDSTVRLWESSSDNYRRVVQDQLHRILDVTFAPDDLSLASGGQDQTVCLWDLQSGRRLSRLAGHTNWVRTVAFSPDGRYLASGGEDCTVLVWDTRAATIRFVLPGHTSWVRAVVFSPDGQILASCGDDQMLRLWDMGTGQLLRTLPGHTNRVRAVVFSPDGQMLASSSEGQSIILWDTASGQRLTTLRGFASWMRSIAFSLDGHMLVGGGEDGSLAYWDVATGQSRLTFQAHASRVRQVSFSPRGQLLASCSDDGTVKLWESKTATCHKTLISERPYERMNITGVQGLTTAQRISLSMLGALEDG